MHGNRTSIPGVPHYETLTNRRDFLARAGGGFGAMAMAYLLGGQPLRAGTPGAASPRSILYPLAPRAGHHAGRAKNVIFLFMEGGASQIDLFDPKPKLHELAGKPLPASFGQPITAMGEYGARSSRRSARGSSTARAARGSATGCPTSPTSSTTSPCCGPATATASTTPAASAK